ncbi:MAG TPA: hypothetical protein VF715_07735 [Thermoleophilaceae bacterium]
MLRALVAALLCALVAAVASGCGTETVGIEAIADAAEASASAGGARLEIEGTGEARGQEFDLSGHGVMDAQGNSEMEMELPGGAGTMKQVFRRFVVYQQMPGLEQQIGAEWMKLDLREAYRRIGVDLELIQQPGGNDPRQMLTQMKNASDEVEKVGTEEVRGEKTTHYKADVDVRKSIERLPPARRAEAKEDVEKVIDVSGLESFPMEVWIDDKDLVRRLHMKMSLNNPAFGGKMDMDMTMELFDYGTPVTIDVPAGDEVKDMTAVVAQQLR